MGYTTDFVGKFELDRKLDFKTHLFLKKLAETRRMARNLGPEYGVEGEFYVGGADDGNFGQDDNTGVIDHNRPPATQPGLWCQWIPTEDGLSIEWDGGEKFYNYVEWLEYIIEKVLKPKGYVLSGEVLWQGEEPGDVGKIFVKDNAVTTKDAKISF